MDKSETNIIANAQVLVGLAMTMVLCLTGHASADVIGPGEAINVNFHGAATTTGPAGPAGTDAFWNQANGDGDDATPSDGAVAGQIRDDDGDILTGVTLRIDSGRTNSNPDWSNDTFWSGDTNNTYAAGSVLTDPVFVNTGITGGSDNRTGWRIKGLPEGEYSIYYILGSRLPGSDPGEGEIAIGLNTSGNAEDIGDFQADSAYTFYEYAGWDSSLTTWAAHDGSGTPAGWNYIVHEFEIADPDGVGSLTAEDVWLELLHDPVPGNNQRIGPAAIQIIKAVPEPASLALVALGGLMLAGRRRQRSR